MSFVGYFTNCFIVLEIPDNLTYTITGEVSLTQGQWPSAMTNINHRQVFCDEVKMSKVIFDTFDTFFNNLIVGMIYMSVSKVLAL